MWSLAINLLHRLDEAKARAVDKPTCVKYQHSPPASG
jgi:hypothetical protein